MKRIRQQFTEGWKFHLGEIPVLHPVKSGMTGGLTSSSEVEEGEWLKIAYFDECEILEPEDGEWKDAAIPHDWIVEGAYRNDHGEVKHHRSHGYLDSGVGFYRKIFRIPKEWEGRRIGLEFEGIFRKSTIWVNGYEVMNHESGYTGFWCELTDILRYGEEGTNVILVRVDAREYEGWWYEGAGIYRKIWLEVMEPVHLKRNGIYAAPQDITEREAAVRTEVTVCNASEISQSCKIIGQILGPEGSVEGEFVRDAEVDAFEETRCEFNNVVVLPKLWSPETPQLYSLYIRLEWQGEAAEEQKVQFGIRTLEFDAEKGFLLNGSPYLLKGTCNHQDFAGVGTALPDSLIEYKLKKLKEMGCNAYRSAHHPASNKLLELCDQMGLLVINENRKLDSTERGIKELEEMILSSRNHPCVFMWSLENEEILEGTVMGARVLRTLKNIAHKLDPLRPVTAAMNHGWNDGGYSDVLDVVGYNYGQRNSQDVKDHITFPHRKTLGTESASCTVTRGVYETDQEKGYCPEYGTLIPEWGCSVEKAWTDVLEHPELSGVFIWTGFDYRGEPTPYSWPNINSHFGVMDTCGFPKSTYHYLKAHWTPEPELFLMPHWNWEGKEGQMIRVWAETNCEEVELFLNGQSHGRKKRNGAVHLEWHVAYEPGTLKASGYRDGIEILQTIVETAGTPKYIELIPDKKRVMCDGEDTVCVEISILDAERRPVVTDDRKLFFETEGPVKILGVGNGDPSCHEPDKAEERSTFHGKCLVILQAEKSSGGRMSFRAKGEGLETAELNLEGENREVKKST